MQESQLPKDELSHVDYSLKAIFSFKWICIFIFILLFAFIATFPIKNNLENLVRSQLAQDRKCPISFNQMSYQILPPGVNMSDIVVPSRCSNGSLKTMTLKNVNASIGGLSFSPIGLVANIKADLLTRPITAKVVQGFSTTSIRLSKQDINLVDIMKLMKDTYRVAGDINVDALVTLEKGQIFKLDTRVQSENLSLPSQNISGFETPNLKINILDAALSIPEGSKNLNIENLILGDPESDLRLRAKGDLKLNQNRFNQSQMNINLEVSPSENLKSQFFILENLLGQYNIKDGFYRIKLNGTVSSPKPRSF